MVRERVFSGPSDWMQETYTIEAYVAPCCELQQVYHFAQIIKCVVRIVELLKSYVVRHANCTPKLFENRLYTNPQFDRRRRNPVIEKVKW